MRLTLYRKGLVWNWCDSVWQRAVKTGKRGEMPQMPHQTHYGGQLLDLFGETLKTGEMFWLRGKDLNLRPLGYEPNELPDCSTPHNHPSV